MLYIPSFKRIPKILLLGFGLVKPFRSSFNAFFCLVLATFLSVTVAPVYNLSLAGTDLVLLHPDHARADIINRKNKACLIGSLLFLVCIFHLLFPFPEYFFEAIIVYCNNK